MATYLLLDGFNLVFRAYYGMPELTRADGFPTHVVHGWLRTVWMLEDQEKPDGMAAFFDLGAPAAREALLPSYKANRKETPPGLEEQVPWVKRLTEALGIAVVESQGVEADDLMGEAAVELAARGDRAVLVSADKDLAQLIRPGIEQLVPPPTANPKLGWKRLDRAGVKEKFGVYPERIPDYLALIGDTSDNIPGVEGVGPKTAVKWLEEHGSLEAIVAKANYLLPARFQSKVAAAAGDLRRNLEMVTLQTGLGVPTLGLRQAPRVEAAVAILSELEMRTAARDCRARYEKQPG